MEFGHELVSRLGRKQSFRLCKTLNIDAVALRLVDTWNPQKSVEAELWQRFAVYRQSNANELRMAQWLLHNLHVSNPPAAVRVA